MINAHFSYPNVGLVNIGQGEYKLQIFWLK